MRNKLKILSLLLIYLISIFLPGCSDQKKRKEFPVGFWGMGSVGHPNIVLGNIVDTINAIYKREERFPRSDRIVKLLNKNKLFIFYSTQGENYQISYWSGETAWIYDYKTNSYYETTKDMMKEKWYPIKGTSPPSNSSLNYYPLYNQGKK